MPFKSSYTAHVAQSSMARTASAWPRPTSSSSAPPAVRWSFASRAMRQEAAVSEFAGFTCEYNVRRVGSQEDVDRIRPLYRDFIRDKNLSIVREDKDWEYRGEGEFGQIGVFHFDDVEYSYLFLSVGCRQFVIDLTGYRLVALAEICEALC